MKKCKDVVLGVVGNTLLTDSWVKLSVVCLLTTREMPTGSGVSSLNRLQSAYLGLQVMSHSANLWGAVCRLTPSFVEDSNSRGNQILWYVYIIVSKVHQGESWQTLQVLLVCTHLKLFFALLPLYLLGYFTKQKQ